MLPYLTLLLSCQLAGTVIQQAFGLPVPGAVIGMAMLFAGLVIRGKLPEGLNATAQGILTYLPLLFVPAGVGVMQQFGLLRAEWLPIAGALIAGTAVTIAGTGAIMQAMLNRTGAKQAKDPGRNPAGNSTGKAGDA